ncbi:hypothetical protein ACSQ67_000931 [Phaseolus vulgaris]
MRKKILARGWSSRKRKAPVIPAENSPSRGRAVSHHASPPGDPSSSPIIMSNFERGVESSRRKGLWDPNLDIASYLESAVILLEDEGRLIVHDGHHLLQEAMRNFNTSKPSIGVSNNSWREKTKESTEQTTRLTEEQSHREKLQARIDPKRKVPCRRNRGLQSESFPSLSGRIRDRRGTA